MAFLAAQSTAASQSFIGVLHHGQLSIKAQHGNIPHFNELLPALQAYLLQYPLKGQYSVPVATLPIHTDVGIHLTKIEVGLSHLSDTQYVLAVVHATTELPLSEKHLTALQIIAQQIHLLLHQDVAEIITHSELASYFHSTLDAVCFIFPNYSIYHYNKIFQQHILEIHGKHIAAGDNVLAYVEPSTFQVFTQNVIAAFEGKEICDEILVPFPTMTKWWEVRYLPVYNAEGNIYCVAFVTRDINEQKKTLLQLTKSEAEARSHYELLQSILDSPKGMIIFSLDQQYCYKAFTISHKEIMQEILDVDIAVGTCILDIITNEEDKLRAKNNFDKALQGEQFMFEEAYGNETLSRRIWESRYAPIFSTTNEVVGLTVFVTDITERKKHEQALIESEQLLNEAQRVARIGNFLVDFATQTWKGSRVLDEILGIDAHFEKTVDNWVRLIAPEIDAERLHLFYQAIFQQRFFSNDYHIIRQTDGERRWISLLGEIVYNDAGQPVQMTGTVQDITERKLAEEQLRLTKERYKFAIEGGGDGIWDWDITHNHIYLSPRGKEMLGYDEDEIGKTIEDWTFLIHPDDVQRVADNLLSHFKNELPIYTIEYRVRCNTGAYKWILARGKVVERNSEGAAMRIVGSHTDINERKKVEQAHAESEKTLQNIFNFSPVPMLLSKVNGGEIVMVNKALARLSGYTRQELLGKDTFQFYHSSFDKEMLIQLYAQQGVIKNVEIPLVNKKGETRISLVSSEAITLQGETVVITGFVDITEQKNIEVALEKSRADLRTIFDNTNIGYALLDKQLYIVSFNQLMQQFANEALGQSLQNDTHINQFFTNTFHENWSVHLAECLNGQSFNYEAAYPQVQKWYQVQLNPVASKFSDSIEGLLFAIEDITSRKKVELELQKSFQLVSEQNKRLLNFSYIVSHNLRSHASNIISISRFLEVLDTEAERKEMVQHLKTVSTALDETLHNLNEVVAIQNNINVHMQLVNVYQYIQNALTILKTQIAEKHAVVKIEVDKEQYIRYNPAYLESILLNFLSNALKYSRPNVVPVILLRMQQIAGEQWQLTIADNGMGIDMQKYGNKLFGMYKTFHGNKDARGIGLFITKNQIEAMGGSVEVQSQPQKGTTFIINFI